MNAWIRPLITATARLGLFLALATWLVSQNWWFRVNTPLLVGDILPGGYVCGLGYPANDWSADAMRVDRERELAWVFGDPIRGPFMNLPELKSSFHAFGITYANYRRFGHVAVRHWLVILSMVSVNVGLFAHRRWRRTADERDGEKRPAAATAPEGET